MALIKLLVDLFKLLLYSQLSDSEFVVVVVVSIELAVWCIKVFIELMLSIVSMLS